MGVQWCGRRQEWSGRKNPSSKDEVTDFLYDPNRLLRLYLNRYEELEI